MIRRLRQFDPTTLGYLGVLSVPDYVYEPLSALRLFALFSVEFVDYAVESDGTFERRERGFVERKQVVRSV